MVTFRLPPAAAPGRPAALLCDAPAVVWDVVAVWDALVAGFAAGLAGAECFGCPLAGRRNTAPASIVAAARISNGRPVGRSWDRHDRELQHVGALAVHLGDVHLVSGLQCTPALVSVTRRNMLGA